MAKKEESSVRIRPAFEIESAAMQTLTIKRDSDGVLVLEQGGDIVTISSDALDAFMEAVDAVTQMS
jgi:hypothetical protein